VGRCRKFGSTATALAGHRRTLTALRIVSRNAGESKWRVAEVAMEGAAVAMKYRHRASGFIAAEARARVSRIALRAGWEYSSG
jgi:hypothetical protein